MDRAFVRAKGGWDKWHDYEMTIAPYENGRRTCPVPCIAIQNFPEGAISSMPLRAEGESKGRAFLGGVLSGAVEPIGAVLTILAAQLAIPALPYFLSFAAGAMLYKALAE